MDDKAMDELSAKYIEIRTAREHLQHEYEAKDAVLAEQMTEVESSIWLVGRERQVYCGYAGDRPKLRTLQPPV